MFKVGDRVERNSVDWPYGDQDGGAGKPGTVSSVERGHDRTVLSVAWDHGGTYIYCPCQLKVAKQSEEDKKETVESLEYRRRNLAIYENMAFTDFIITCKTGEE